MGSVTDGGLKHVLKGMPTIFLGKSYAQLETLGAPVGSRYPQLLFPTPAAPKLVPHRPLRPSQVCVLHRVGMQWVPELLNNFGYAGCTQFFFISGGRGAQKIFSS